MPPKSMTESASAQAEERSRAHSTPRASRPDPKWCRLVFEDYLRETANLTPAEEGVYARLCVLICRSGDCLPAEDRSLGYALKVGRAWPRYRQTFLNAGLITVEAGCIRQARCTMEIARSRAAQEDRAAGGHAKAAHHHLEHLVREVNPQVSENIDDTPCSSTTDIDKEDPSPTGKGDGVVASQEADPWEDLDMPALRKPSRPPEFRRPEPPLPPAPALTVVPLPDLTPEQQVQQAQRLMDKALVDALVAIQVPARSAWGLMAKWKNAVGRDKVMDLIGQVQRNPPAGPVVGWINRMVQRETERKDMAGRRTSDRPRGYGEF